MVFMQIETISVQTTETDRALRDAIDIVSRLRKSFGNERRQEAVMILLNIRAYLTKQLSIDGFVQEVSR